MPNKILLPSGAVVDPFELFDKLASDRVKPIDLNITPDDNNEVLMALSKQADQYSLYAMYLLCSKFSLELPRKVMSNFLANIARFSDTLRSEPNLFLLAKMYEYGVIFNVNHKSAAAIYEQLIEEYESQEAMLCLSYMLENNQVGTQPDGKPNLDRAKALCEMAVEKRQGKRQKL